VNVADVIKAFGPHWEVNVDGKLGAEERQVCYFERVDSTSDEVERRFVEIAASGAEQVLFLAKEQFAGHGRLGRAWHAPAGQALTLTLVMREPAVYAEHLGLLPLTVGWSVLRALGLYLPWKSLELKWPNDIWFDSKKISGTLCQRRLIRGQAWLSLGIGINVGEMSFPEDLKPTATSMAFHCESLPSIETLAESVVDSVVEDLTSLNPKESLAMVRQRCLMSRGQDISFEHSGVEKRGATCGLGDDGALLCRFEDGRVEGLQVSEVQMVRPSSHR
jgi:BirA family biotin operon repressor/biotin-[acetyl-CoA-carboxylase] ligase